MSCSFLIFCLFFFVLRRIDKMGSQRCLGCRNLKKKKKTSMHRSFKFSPQLSSFEVPVFVKSLYVPPQHEGFSCFSSKAQCLNFRTAANTQLQLVISCTFRLLPRELRLLKKHDLGIASRQMTQTLRVWMHLTCLPAHAPYQQCRSRLQVLVSL